MLRRLSVMLTITALLLGAALVGAQDGGGAVLPAEIVNDEGGPAAVTGSVAYSNPFFTAGVASPLIIMEDQAGFVDRNKGFVMSKASQTIGQITSDFFTSPFTYSLALPIEPQGERRDVSNGAASAGGVQIFAIAYWTNIWGDPFLEERDLFGGGWSTAYVSTRISPDPNEEGEVIGGRYIVYAPDDEQGFPSSFGPDGRLFTGDEPIVLLPEGYTIVEMDSEPFTFDRTRHPVIDLIEGEASEVSDFSGMSYTEAFDAMIAKMRNEYAFTENKGIDWDAKIEEFRPRFEEAEANDDAFVYLLALRDFAWSIPDGHVSGPFNALIDLFLEETDGGIGMAIRELDDGRVIASYILVGSPADEAGIERGAEIIAFDGQPIADVISGIRPWSMPFSTEHVLRLQQMRYATRFPVGTDVDVIYQNPGAAEPQTETLTTIPERQSFSFSSFSVGLTGFELPLEFRLLDSGLGYVKIYSFFDNEVLTIQLWERMIQTMNENGVPGLIIDMRQNGGGSGWLADQMAAYFFNEPLVLGNNGFFSKDTGEFFFDENRVDQFILPAENLRYHGAVAVLVGPSCASACEFFSYNMTLQDRAAIVGQYPTAGLGGSVEQFYMPEDETFQFTIGRAVNAEGEIHIEGIGVVPTVQVPVNEDTLFAGGDVILQAAVNYLTGASAAQVEIVEGGEIAVGDSVDGELAPGVRVMFTFTAPAEATTVDIVVSDADNLLDTVLRIYSADGELLAENDDLEPGKTIGSGFLGAGLDGGEVLILEVAGFEDAEEGAFTLSITEAAGS